MTAKIEYVSCRKGSLSGAVRSDHLTGFWETVGAYGSDRFLWCKNRPKIGAGTVNGCFVKCYHYNGLYSRIRHIFRKSRAVHCARCAENLLDLQIPTPEVFGYCRKSRFGLPVCDYLVTEALKEDTLFYDRIYPGDPEKTAEELASLAWKLHRAGFLHGDLNLRNIYRTAGNSCGVIDLDGSLMLTAVPSAEERRKELARLVSSALKTLPAGRRDAELESGAKRFAAAYRRCGGEDFYGAELLHETLRLISRYRN